MEGRPGATRQRVPADLRRSPRPRPQRQPTTPMPMRSSLARRCGRGSRGAANRARALHRQVRGGRLCFGIGEHAPEPSFRWRSAATSPTRGLTPALAFHRRGSCRGSRSGKRGSVGAGLQGVLGDPVSRLQRRRLLADDPVALWAAWTAAQHEGAISDELGEWRIRCMVFIGRRHEFITGAGRAAERIPGAGLMCSRTLITTPRT